MVKQPNQHLIHKQVLDVTISPNKQRSSVEEDLKTLLYRDAAPVMEQVFDEVSREGDYIYIDKLEIDLGKLAPEELNRKLLTSLRQKLEEALGKLLDQETKPYQRSPKEIPYSIDQKMTSDDGQRTVIRYTYEQIIRTAFFRFLITSVLPETMRPFTIQELEAEMIRLQLTDASLVSELRKLNKQLPYTTQRLAYQFSSHFLENLLKHHDHFYEAYKESGIKLFHDLLLKKAAGSHTISDDVYASWVENLVVVFLEETEHDGTNWRKLVQFLLTRWYKVFLIKQDQAKKEAIKKTTEQWYTRAFHNKNSFAEKLIALLQKESGNPEEESSDNQKTPTDLNETITSPQGDKTKSSDTPSKWAGEYNENQTDGTGKPDPSSIDYIKRLFQDDEKKRETEEYHYIDNSGLVLLTPYLQILYEELDLVRENQFINREAQIRAVFLLHYLVNQDEWPDEPNLVFNKILCGLPIKIPMPKNVELEDYEIRECDKLLHAVIKNWEALKNTTPQGLCEGFLQRSGKLSKVDNGWKLHVEQDTIDILLDSLPWSYQIVSFPWMEQMVFVEWN